VAFLQGLGLFDDADQFTDFFGRLMDKTSSFYALLEDRFEALDITEIECPSPDGIGRLAIEIAAALLGAPKCFKVVLDKTTGWARPGPRTGITIGEAAIAGGSMEIVRELQTRGVAFAEDSLWVTALKYRRPNLFVWLLRRRSKDDLVKLGLPGDICQIVMRDGVERTIELVQKTENSEIQKLVGDLKTVSQLLAESSEHATGSD
jgi:hypothetical protein